MKVVIADTSPINYLILIDAIDVLSCLYSRIVIPVEVLRERTDADTPPVVATWADNRPDWLDVQHASAGSADASLRHLDAGEAAAILLAQRRA